MLTYFDKLQGMVERGKDLVEELPKRCGNRH